MRTLLFSTAFLLAASSVFAQATPGWTYIQQQTSNNYGLFVQGQTGSAGSISLEANGNSAVYWLGVTTDNYLKIGGNGASIPATGAINIDGNGNVGIGTLNTTNYKFNCAGSAVFDGVTVTTFSSNNPKASPWADYVFDKGYQLPSLQSVAAYIAANHHLDGVPTRAEVQKNGLDLGASQAKLLEKIEQLTLYTIDLQKQADQLRKQVETLQDENRKLADMQMQIDALKAGMTPAGQASH